MIKKHFSIIILLVALIFVFGFKNNCYAASATIGSSATEVEIGTSVNIIANVKEASAWALDVSASGGNLNTSEDRAGTTSSGQNENQTIKIGTFSANTAGEYKITLGGYVVNGEDLQKKNVGDSIKIVVKEKEQTPPPQEEKPTEPEQPATPNENDKPTTPSENEKPENPSEEKPTEQPTAPQEEPKPTTPEITYTNINKTMYVKTTGVNVWKENNNKSAGAKRQLKLNEAVTVVAIASNGWYKVSDGYIDGNYLTDKKPEEEQEKIESSTASLANMVVKPGNLNETFAREKYDYTMTVEADVDSVEITATPTDNKAKVMVTGNTGLTTGTSNIIVVRVVAEDGISSKTYKINVTKLATEDENPNIIEENKIGLISLEIEGITLSPTFNRNTYEYTAKLTDMTVNKLKVNAVASDEKAKMEITGADEIKEGENAITIIVTSENGEETSTYQVIVTKKEETPAVTVPKVEDNKTQDSGKTILLIGVGAAIIVIILVFIILRKKENVKGSSGFDDGDYGEEDEDYNTFSQIKKDNEIDNNSSQDEEEYNYEDDDDDDWGTPKRGFRSKFRKAGRHF